MRVYRYENQKLSSQLSTPNCAENCQQPHTLRVAAYLLGCSPRTLYLLMNDRKIAWIETDYGRRISHVEITRYLNEKTYPRTIVQ